ncbi:U3 snoRNP protein [Lecanora helva]
MSIQAVPPGPSGQTTPHIRQELEEAIDELDLVPTEKDEKEIELERVVFGDEEGFHNSLEYSRATHPASHTHESTLYQENQEEDEGVEGLDDADLFFLDTGSSRNKASLPLFSSLQNEEEPDPNDRDCAAWVDSDDERLTVSLASNPRLRKLRLTESEDRINGEEYIKRLRHQFQRLYPVPDWAQPSSKKSRKRRRRDSDHSASPDLTSDDDDGSGDLDDIPTQPLAKLLQNTGNLTRITTATSSHRRKLRPGVIDIQRGKDVGTAQVSAVTSLHFHPIHPLLLSSGPSAMLSLYHVSPNPPNPNPLLTTLHLRSTPLATAMFSLPSGDKIVFSGRRRYFHTWDLERGRVEKISRVIGHEEGQTTMERFKLSPCGRWMGLVGSARKGGGTVNIIDTSTCQWIAEVRVEGNGGVADFAWWGDGAGMLLLGKGGEAVEWDGQQKRVVARWTDEGAVGITVVALGGKGTGCQDLGGDRWAVVGSSSGIVNIYDRKKWVNSKSIPARPKPVRALDQLTTPVSHLDFSPDGQVLCMTSRWKRDSLKLVHLPSCTVYKNWPTSSTPLGRITSIAWSPNSEMIATSNEQGKIRLWVIRR